jgi:hypothetical protein
MPEKPITKGISPEVKQVLENLKTTNPNEYNKLGQSIFGQTDPMLRNKVMEQFKADPMGYINKFKTPVTKAAPAKPINTFDDYYTKGTIPTVQGFKIDNLGNKSSVNNPVLDPRFKEAKGILQNFYDLKIQNPSNPLLKEEIYKVDKIAKLNPTFKNSDTYKLFQSDKIDYVSKATGFNGVRDQKEYDAIVQDPKKLMKVGFEYSSFDPGQLGYTKEFYNKINPDLDKIANAPTDKPLKLSNGETLSKEQVVNLKANLTKTGREFAYKQYQDNFQNKILPELEKLNTEFKSAEKQLESSIKKLKGAKDKLTYNKIYKEEYEPLKAKYSSLYDTVYKTDESLKYDEKKLQTIVNGKSKEEQRVQQLTDFQHVYKPMQMLTSFGEGLLKTFGLGKEWERATKNVESDEDFYQKLEKSNFNKISNLSLGEKAFSRVIGVAEKTFAIKDIFNSDLNIALQHIDPVKAPVAWSTGKVDKDGNPVMSNQVMWYENKDDAFPSFNLGAVAEEGAFQTINMIGVGKLTGLLGGIVAKGANLASKHYSLTNAALNISAKGVMNAGIPIKWGTSGLSKAGKFLVGENLNLGARALTFPSVYATTYGRNYVENINNFRTISEAKDYAVASSVFESLTESIVPDVFFFSKTGLNKLGTVLNNKQFSFYKQFLADAAKGNIKKANIKALGASLGQMGINTLQEALIEEELNYFAMSKYEDIKSEEDPLYVRQQEKATFEGAVDLGLESLATMSISMLTGLPGQYREHKQAYGYDFSKPENLAYHRFNVAVNADLLRESILKNNEISKEDKIKQLETIEKYESHLKNASQAIQKPDRKTLANDEDNIYAYFHASTEKEKLEEKILNNTLSPSEQKKYEDFQLLIDKLDKENNDWARLEPEQRQNTWWKWFRESITESKDNDPLKNSLLFAQGRVVNQKNIVKKQYEDGHITKEMYDQFMSNIGKAEQQVEKSRKAKIQTNLDRLDELSERELEILQEDLQLDKALDNENTISYISQPVPLELKTKEPLITYNEVLDNLPKDFAVDLTYTTPSGKEFNILAVEENGLLIDKKTGEVIPKEVTVKKAATIQPTINDVRVDTEQEFLAKKKIVKDRHDKIYSERLAKTFEGFSPELQSKIKNKHDEFNNSDLTVEEFAKELNAFIEQNLPETTDDQTKNDVVDLIVNKTFIENKIKPTEVIEEVETPPITRVETTEAFTSERDIKEEIAKLQEQLANAENLSDKLILKNQIKELEAKLNTLETEEIPSNETVVDTTVITPENEKEVKKLKLQIFLLENENKVVTLNNLTGTLTIINEDRVEIEKDDVIYEIQTSEIVSYKEEIKSDKYNISNLTETSVTVNGVDYVVNLDNKGNIESISPTNKPQQKIKNNALLIKIEIERNKLETNTKVENVSEKLIKNNYKNLDDLLNNIYNVNFTDTINTALDKLYDNKKLTDSEKLQLGLWLEDAFSRISNLFDAKNTEEEKETLLNAYDNLEIMFSLLHGIPFKTSTKKEKNERKNNVGKTEIEQSSEESKRKNIKQSEKSEKLIELQNKLEDLQTPKEQEEVVVPPVVTKVETVPVTEEVIVTTKETPIEETQNIITYDPSQKVTEEYIRKNAKKVGDRTQVTFILNDKHGVIPEGISNPLTISTSKSLEDLITMLLYDQSNMEFNKSNPLAKYKGLLYLLEELNKVDSYDKLSNFAKEAFNETKKELDKAFERFKSIIIKTPNAENTIQNIPETTDTKTNELVSNQSNQQEVERLRAEEQVENAEIERKKREELDNIKNRIFTDRNTQYAHRQIVKDLESAEFKLNAQKGYLNLADNTSAEIDRFKKDIKETEKEVEKYKNQLSNFIDSYTKEINDKYDAKLADVYDKYDKLITPLLKQNNNEILIDPQLQKIRVAGVNAILSKVLNGAIRYYTLNGKRYQSQSEANDNKVDFTPSSYKDQKEFQSSVTNLSSAVIVGDYLDFMYRNLFTNQDLTFEELTSLLQKEPKFDLYQFIHNVEVVEKAKEQVNKIKSELIKKHSPKTGKIKFITDPMFVYENVNEDPFYDGMGGMLDMIVVDENNQNHIYDFKNKFAKNSESALQKTKKENQDKWATQQSTYARLLEQLTGLKVSSINAVVIPTQYVRDPFKGETKEQAEKFQATPELVGEYPLISDDTFIIPLERKTQEIKKDTSIQSNKIVSLYKELISTGKLKFTDEEGKPC